MRNCLLDSWIVNPTTFEESVDLSTVRIFEITQFANDLFRIQLVCRTLTVVYTYYTHKKQIVSISFRDAFQTLYFRPKGRCTSFRVKKLLSLHCMGESDLVLRFKRWRMSIRGFFAGNTYSV